MRILLLVTLLLAFQQVAPVRTWQVLPDSTGDAPTIQAGIDSAAPGDTVLVANGTYTGSGNKNLDFLGKDLVLRSENGPESTTIDCEEDGSGFYLGTPSSSAASIEGFTIRNGRSQRGAGICLDTTNTVVVRECHIDSNTATGQSSRGGGVYVHNGTIEMVGCRIEQNSAQVGGGLYTGNGDLSMKDCKIRGNWAGAGGGIYDYKSGLSLDSCLVSGNAALDSISSGSGGGLFAYYDDVGYVQIERSTFAGNRADWTGGGMELAGIDLVVDFYWSILWGNRAGECGSAVYSVDTEPTWHCSDVDTTEFRRCGGWGYWFFTFSEDPLFCNPADPMDAPAISGDYSLDAASPCLSDTCATYRQIGYHGAGCDVVTGVAAGDLVPSKGVALWASPNPSRGRIDIRYSLPASAPSHIHVYDIRGRLISALDASSPTGFITWDGTTSSGRKAAPGIYFLQLTGEGKTETQRITLVR